MTIRSCKNNACAWPCQIFVLAGLNFRLLYCGTVELRRMMQTRSVEFGVAIPQTATYRATKVPAPAVELSNCFCGHCSAISIERFRRKVSFSGIAGVSEWMARRRHRSPFSAHRRPVSNQEVYRISILPFGPFIEAENRKKKL